jgi:nitrite reductase/ring-hydroxylating ferredoxin subunit
MTTEIDAERVLCSLDELDATGCRAFTVGEGDWPLRGLVVRKGDRVYAYQNRCPHAGHPLNLKPHDFLTPDGSLIVCCSHGALFDKTSGYCIDGPCAGDSLTAIPVSVVGNCVMLDQGVRIEDYEA